MKHLEGTSGAFRLKSFHRCPSDSSTGAERFIEQQYCFCSLQTNFDSIYCLLSLYVVHS